MSVALICHYTAFSFVLWESRIKLLLCFVTRMLSNYFYLVYGFLIAAEAVNMFVKVVLVFKKIDHFPLKASLVAWSKSSCSGILSCHLFRNLKANNNYYACISYSCSCSH